MDDTGWNNEKTITVLVAKISQINAFQWNTLHGRVITTQETTSFLLSHPSVIQWMRYGHLTMVGYTGWTETTAPTGYKGILPLQDTLSSMWYGLFSNKVGMLCLNLIAWSLEGFLNYWKVILWVADKWKGKSKVVVILYTVITLLRFEKNI